MPKNSQSDHQNAGNQNVNEQTVSTTNSLNQSGHVENQNQSHNTKKVALGPNTKR